MASTPLDSSKGLFGERDQSQLKASGCSSSNSSSSRYTSSGLERAQVPSYQQLQGARDANERHTSPSESASLQDEPIVFVGRPKRKSSVGRLEQRHEARSQLTRPDNSSASKSCVKSYSKLFRKYLPSALSLNLKRRQENYSNSNETNADKSAPQSKQRASPIANAFGRLKLNSPQASSSSSHTKAPLEQAKGDQPDETSKRHQNAHLLKRKGGFLYLKKSGAGSEPLVSRRAPEVSRELRVSFERPPSSEPPSIRQAPQAGNKRGAFSAKHFKRDLNNNSLSSLLAPNSAHARLHDGQSSRLLEEEDDEQLETIAPSRSRSALQEAAKMRASSHKSQNQKHEHEPSQREKLASRSLLAAGFVLALVFGLLGFAQLAAGQQQQPQLQQPQPFSRSQPGGVATAPGGAGQRLAAPLPAAGSLVANINCNKIRGHVTLTPNARGSGATVSTQISAGPPGEVYQWSVHQFPVKPGAAMCSCSPLILGTKLIDLSDMHGNLPSDQEFNVQSSLNLFGADSPVGHSLMLRGMKTGMVACATFLPTRKSNYRAKFHTPLSGSVTIFQTAFGTSFISHLMYSNGTRRHSMHRFDLVKSEDDVVTHSLLSGQQAGSASSSRALEHIQGLEQREHEHELTQCRRFTSGEALFKNITFQLAVSTENFGMRGRTAMVLPQIPFETFSSVYVVVYSEHDPSEPIACAPLKFVKPKTAAAKFQTVSVQGSVLFSQDSPYDVTVARVNLNMPNSDGHSYGIDELPMIIRRKSDTRVCPNIREIIYNPHHVDSSTVPLEGEATSDQYAVGDLSGKYGSLTGKASEKIQVNDYNLPLFGPISVVGRAMTIYSAEGVAIACSNVELTTPMLTAFATFDYGIQGQFIFRQPVNDCNGDTYVYIEVSQPPTGGATSSSQQQSVNSEPARSLDHNWHIHVNPVDSGLDHLSTTECNSAGPHYNPYNTSTASIYSRDCTPFNVLRCELGDLSAKMFTIDIPPYRVKGGQEPDIGKFFGTDIDLPLCGPVSVVNRSVVVHVQDFGHQRLACSTVIEFKPRAN